MTKQYIPLSERDLSTICKADLVELGKTPEQAALIVKMMKLFPFSEERHEPTIDLRTAWENIGKPHGEFRKWVSRAVRQYVPEIGQEDDSDVFGQKCPDTRMALDDWSGHWLEYQKDGARANQKNYLVSRTLCLRLAMKANTPEGEAVCAYFQTLEELLDTILTTMRCRDFYRLDSRLMTIIRNEEVRSKKPLSSTERQIQKNIVWSRFVAWFSGYKASKWTEYYRKGIRGTLYPRDLEVLASSYASFLEMAGQTNLDSTLADLEAGVSRFAAKGRLRQCQRRGQYTKLYGH